MNNISALGKVSIASFISGCFLFSVYLLTSSYYSAQQKSCNTGIAPCLSGTESFLFFALAVIVQVILFIVFLKQQQVKGVFYTIFFAVLFLIALFLLNIKLPSEIGYLLEYPGMLILGYLTGTFIRRVSAR